MCLCTHTHLYMLYVALGKYEIYTSLWIFQASSVLFISPLSLCVAEEGTRLGSAKSRSKGDRLKGEEGVIPGKQLQARITRREKEGRQSTGMDRKSIE